MKHIFTIHSHVTFLVAYSTIQHLSLNEKDVILLTTHYKPLAGNFRLAKSFPDKYKNWYHKLIRINVPASHDRYITRLTKGDNFIAYIDLMSYYQKILITHSLCNSFNFIEEGNGAYQSVDNLTDITWPERSFGYRIKNYFDSPFIKALARVLRGYNLRLLGIPYNYMAFVNFKDLKFFCLSENSYYNAPKEKKIILRPEVSNDFLKMSLGYQLQNEVLWMDGSNNRYTGLDEKYYHDAVNMAISKFQEKGIIKDKVFVKLRPKEDVNNNYLINSLKKNNIAVEILPDYLVPEALFIVSNECIVIGNLSAALEYAHCFGHEAYSIYSLFQKRVPTFFDRMPGYWKNVKSI